MIKYKSSERKVDMYDIGDGLTLMNIIEKILNNSKLESRDLIFSVIISPYYMKIIS